MVPRNMPQQAVELHITCQLVPSCTRSGHHKCIVAHTSLFGVSLYAGGSTALITYYLTGNGGTVLDVIKVGGWALHRATCVGMYPLPASVGNLH